MKDSSQVKGQNLEDMEPSVTILKSEYASPELQEGKLFSLKAANDFLGKLNQRLTEEKKSYTVSVKITCFYKQDILFHTEHITLGAENGGLIDLLRPEKQFIPYLKNHCLLSDLEEKAQHAIQNRALQGIVNTEDGEYWKELIKYVYTARKALNQDYSSLKDVQIPQKKDYRKPKARAELTAQTPMELPEEIPKSILEKLHFYQEKIRRQELEEGQLVENLTTK